MATKKRIFYDGEFYHVVLRGVEGRKIFMDDQDYYRIIHDIFEFNDQNCVISTFRQDNYKHEMGDKNKRKLLVNIHAFCLMPNHIHLLLEQKVDGGLSKFMLKLGAGYASFFNSKYKHSGHLFQGRFKSILIKDDTQLSVIFSYIHTNPVAILQPNWKEDGIKDLKKTKEFIENYKWSSYSDYLGNKNFPSLTQREFMLDDREKEAWQKFVNDWLEYKEDIFKKHFWDVNQKDYLLE